MRQRALNRGYTLNEHGMNIMLKGDKPMKGDKVSHQFFTENDIFNFLEMEYKVPKERLDGRAVQDKIIVNSSNSINTVIVEEKKIIKIKKNTTLKKRKPLISKIINDFKKKVK